MGMDDECTTVLTNYGRNITFTPEHILVPHNESELLNILERHRKKKIRVVGSLHSWSPLVECPEVIINMKCFDSVQICVQKDGNANVTVGAGCTIKQLLLILKTQGNFTLPTLGAVTDQTIAGAIATATHGVGKPSLSDYVTSIRAMRWNQEAGKGEICEYTNPTELQAARCSLGCMGVVLSLCLICVPRYLVEESVASYTRLEKVLETQGQYSLTAFFLIPWRWNYVAQLRRELPFNSKRSWWAIGHRLFRAFWVQFVFNVVVQFFSNVVVRPFYVRWFYQYPFRLFTVSGPPVIDDAESILVMEIPFRHMEMELFVSEGNVVEATEYIQEMLEFWSGVRRTVSPHTQQMLNSIKMFDTIVEHQGSYTHRYPILFRRVLKDDTLISMTCGKNLSWYAISFMTFESKLFAFTEFASFLAHSMAKLFNARPHWGKYCPLSRTELETLYPELDTFRSVCRKFDSIGMFHNDFVQKKIGL